LIEAMSMNSAPAHGVGGALLEQHAGDDGAVFEQADDGVGGPHRIGQAGMHRHAMRGQRRGLVEAAVPGVHLVPGGGQAARHRKAHVAGAEDGEFHAQLLK
jgi:hypothetical protein